MTKVQTPEQFLKERIGVLEGHDHSHLSEWDKGALAAYKRIMKEVEHGHMSLLHREAFQANQRGLARLGNKAKRLADIVKPLREAMTAQGSEAATLTGHEFEDCVVEVHVGTYDQARLLAQTLNGLRPKPRPHGHVIKDSRILEQPTTAAQA